MRRARVFLLALFAAHSSLLANTLQWAPAPNGPWQNVSAEIETEVDGTFAYSAVAQGREGYFRLLMSDGKVADIIGLKPTLTMTFRPPAVQPPRSRTIPPLTSPERSSSPQNSPSTDPSPNSDLKNAASRTAFSNMSAASSTPCPVPNTRSGDGPIHKTVTHPDASVHGSSSPTA